MLGSILPAGTEPEVFLRELGIVKKQAVIGDARWTLVGKNLELIEEVDGQEGIPLSDKLLRALDRENRRRGGVSACLERLRQADPLLAGEPLLDRWLSENAHIPVAALTQTACIPVIAVAADPAHTNERIAFSASGRVREILGGDSSGSTRRTCTVTAEPTRTPYIRIFATSPSWTRQPAAARSPLRPPAWAVR